MLPESTDRDLDDSQNDADSGSFVVMLDSGNETEKLVDATTDSGDESFCHIFSDSDSDASQEPDTASDDGSFVVLLDDDKDESIYSSIVTSKGDREFQIDLPADIRIQHIIELKTELMSTLDAAQVTYNVAKVKLLDTASMQLIAAHVSTLEEHETKIFWQGESTEFVNTADRLGIELGAQANSSEL